MQSYHAFQNLCVPAYFVQKHYHYQPLLLSLFLKVTKIECYPHSVVWTLSILFKNVFWKLEWKYYGKNLVFAKSSCNFIFPAIWMVPAGNYWQWFTNSFARFNWFLLKVFPNHLKNNIPFWQCDQFSFHSCSKPCISMKCLVPLTYILFGQELWLETQR